MTAVFADSFFYLALLNPRDPAHARAVAFGRGHTGLIVTTGFVLTEVADGMARTPWNRELFVRLHARLSISPQTLILPCSEDLFRLGLDLYAARPDKGWSLTDCVSFVVMARDGLTDALTGDRHFAQAGFVPLLAP